MREHRDYTPDNPLKKICLDEARKQGAPPHLVFDDRQKVVDMWREEGVPCIQVSAVELLMRDAPKQIWVSSHQFGFTEGVYRTRRTAQGQQPYVPKADAAPAGGGARVWGCRY